MKLVKTLVASAAILASLGANAAVTGALGGGFGSFATLSGPGTPNSGGAISNAGNLVFIGATIDGYFRAFDARNGKELWRDRLPAPSQGIPTTYMGRDGKQYVVVGANGGGFFGAPSSDEVIAYRLK